jgi:hypothetical protein
MRGCALVVVAVIVIGIPLAAGFLYSENTHYVEQINIAQANNADLTNRVNVLSDQVNVAAKLNEANHAKIALLENENNQLHNNLTIVLLENETYRLQISQLTAVGQIPVTGKTATSGWDLVPLILFLAAGLVIGAAGTYFIQLWVGHRNVRL